MGCGCKERGRLLASAAKHVSKGDLDGTVKRLQIVSASAAKDLRTRLASARLKASRRKHG